MLEETFLRTIRPGIPYTLLLGIEAIEFPTFWPLLFVVLYCNFTSLAFLGLLGFLIRQLKIKFIATLLRAAKYYRVSGLVLLIQN